mmetsp:Transcript_22/g.59  ORF Transcript_22/g.59 Transcript_22/m.59 type:complete len:221 (-) Transcript_22:647-1309(-)|eukprot:scaffold9559_cov101-Isochrysis_galbana.AAC.6
MPSILSSSAAARFWPYSIFSHRRVWAFCTPSICACRREAASLERASAARVASRVWAIWAKKSPHTSHSCARRIPTSGCASRALAFTRGALSDAAPAFRAGRPLLPAPTMGSKPRGLCWWALTAARSLLPSLSPSDATSICISLPRTADAGRPVSGGSPTSGSGRADPLPLIQRTSRAPAPMRDWAYSATSAGASFADTSIWPNLSTSAAGREALTAAASE